MKHIRKRITYANVMSSIAVFLVLGSGAAYAAKKIGSNEIKGNSITTGKIKKEAVSASKLKKDSVTTAKIANGAVTGAKLNLGTVGTVPNASHATNADHATTADNVNGQTATKIFKTLSAGQSNVLVATIAGFTITASCETINVDVFIKSPTGQGSVLNSEGSGGNLGEPVETFDYDSSNGSDSSEIQIDQEIFGGGGPGEALYGVSSVTGALANGVTISGVIGYDYETFADTPPNTCVVYGHVLAG